MSETLGTESKEAGSCRIAERELIKDTEGTVLSKNITLMKFGKHLKREGKREWEAFYVNYKSLKKSLSGSIEPQRKDYPSSLASSVSLPIAAHVPPTTTDMFIHDIFLTLLDSEIDKVNRFYMAIEQECTKQFDAIVSHLQSEHLRIHSSRLFCDDRDLMNDTIQFVDTLDHLRKYTVLNYIALVKIIKKHNKQILDCDALHPAKLLLAQPFYKSKVLLKLVSEGESIARLVFSNYGAAFPLESPHPCNICFNQSANPVILSCGHPFCWECLCLSSPECQRCPVCHRDQILNPTAFKIDRLLGPLLRSCVQGYAPAQIHHAAQSHYQHREPLDEFVQHQDFHLSEQKTLASGQKSNQRTIFPEHISFQSELFMEPFLFDPFNPTYNIGAGPNFSDFGSHADETQSQSTNYFHLHPNLEPELPQSHPHSFSLADQTGNIESPTHIIPTSQACSDSPTSLLLQPNREANSNIEPIYETKQPSGQTYGLQAETVFFMPPPLPVIRPATNQSLQIDIITQPPNEVRTRTPREIRNFSLIASVDTGGLEFDYSSHSMFAELYYAPGPFTGPEPYPFEASDKIFGGSRLLKLERNNTVVFSGLTISEASTRHHEKEFTIRLTLINQNHPGRVLAEKFTEPIYAYSHKKVLLRRKERALHAEKDPRLTEGSEACEDTNTETSTSKAISSVDSHDIGTSVAVEPIFVSSSILSQITKPGPTSNHEDDFWDFIQ